MNAAEFNRWIPIGTKVIYQSVLSENRYFSTITTSKAWYKPMVGRNVVRLKGLGDPVSIKHVQIATKHEEQS